MSDLPLNVGRVDAAVRFALVVATILFDAWVLHSWSVDWSLLAMIHGFLGIYYFLLTALFRIDPLYLVFGKSTLRGSRASRVRAQRLRHRSA